MSDASERYLGWSNDPELQLTLGRPARNWNETQAAAHIAKFDGINNLHLGIFPKGESLPVGFCTIIIRKNDSGMTTLVIGEPSRRNLWTALETGRRLQRFAFTDLNHNKTCAVVNSTNRQAIALCIKIGYSLEGILKEHYKNEDGSRSDEYKFGMLKSEWESASQDS
jgi:RimJ/RimL family protein N-acetyltransferase